MCLIFQVKPSGLIFSALKYLWRKQMVMLFLENISLRRFHTFATEAKARYYLEFSSSDELREMWKARPGLFSQVLVMGGGSNLLFTGDYPGMVIRPAVTGIALEKEDDRHVWLRAGAGVVWDDFVSFAVDAGWGGVENLSLIPGMVGAVPVQNIGAYGCEAASVISSVTGVEFPSGEIRDYDASSCRFAYRSSVFKEQLREKFIITSVVFRLDKTPQLKLEYGELKMEVMKKFKGSKASPFNSRLRVPNSRFQVSGSRFQTDNRLLNTGFPPQAKLQISATFSRSEFSSTISFSMISSRSPATIACRL